MSKKQLERLGGMGSMGTGVFCVWLAMLDKAEGQSIWVVWVGMAVILVLNGIAMIWHASRRPADEPLVMAKSGPVVRAGS